MMRRRVIAKGSGLEHIIGDAALQASSFASTSSDGAHVEFLVTARHGPRYAEHCWQVEAADDAAACIRRYTDHPTKLYEKVNLSLAADSPALREHAAYVRQLRASIYATPLHDDGDGGVVYRGVELSAREVAEMERLRHFYIPSFTSTSVERARAYAKTHTLVVKVPYASKCAVTITPELSKFYDAEREVLLACYTAYTLERVERTGAGAGGTVITLCVDEHASVACAAV